MKLSATADPLHRRRWHYGSAARRFNFHLLDAGRTARRSAIADRLGHSQDSACRLLAKKMRALRPALAYERGEAG
jgi:hypothetical protein